MVPVALGKVLEMKQINHSSPLLLFLSTLVSGSACFSASTLSLSHFYSPLLVPPPPTPIACLFSTPSRGAEETRSLLLSGQPAVIEPWACLADGPVSKASRGEQGGQGEA